MHTKSEYIAQLRQQLNDIGSMIDEYEIRIRHARGDACTLYQDSLFRLQQQWRLARDRLAALQELEDYDWDHFAPEADGLRDVLAESYDAVRVRLQSVRSH